MAEPNLTYGKNPEGRLVHIKDVPSGLACNCVCPSCGEKQEKIKNDAKEVEILNKLEEFEKVMFAHIILGTIPQKNVRALA